MMNKLLLTAKILPMKIGQTMAFQNVQINTNTLNNVDPVSMFGTAIGVVLTMIQMVGIAVAIFGVVQIAQSLGDEGDPQKRVKGFSLLGSGIIMIGLKVILNWMGLIA